MTQVRVIIRTKNGYWAKSSSLDGAVRQLRKAGARGVLDASITVAIGKPEDISGIQVSSYGDITAPHGTELHHIGTIRISTRKASK